MVLLWFVGRGGCWEFRYLVLFYYGLFNKIYDKIKYLMSELVGGGDGGGGVGNLDI